MRARYRGLAGAFLALAGCCRLHAQYDKIAGGASDSQITPIAGPASAPPIESGSWDLPDLRPTGYLNDQLPRWLQFGFEERVRFEGYEGSGFKPNVDDSYVLNRFRLGMIVQPVSWFRIVAQTQDARSFLQTPPIGPPNTVRWDLKLAYAEFGDPEKQWITLKVGRQEIDYNDTIIANSEWRNQARSYDGVVTDIHVDRFRVGLFAASVVNPLLNGISHHQEGNNIYGAYGNVTHVLPKSAIEPFVLWRVEPSLTVEPTALYKAKTGHLDEKAYGFRVKGREISNFDYRFEEVYEGGHAGPDPINAWGSTAGVGYTVPEIGWRPRFFATGDFASGDKNPKDGTRNTFDTMYPTAHDRFGISDQFGWQNIIAWRAGATVNPHHRFSVTGQYLDFWLDSATDALYNTSGGVILRDTTGRSGTHIGDEVDGYTWYEVNREVHIGAGIAHIFPGEFLMKAGKGASYTYPYFVVEMFDGKRVK